MKFGEFGDLVIWRFGDFGDWEIWRFSDLEIGSLGDWDLGYVEIRGLLLNIFKNKKQTNQIAFYVFSFFIPWQSYTDFNDLNMLSNLV